MAYFITILSLKVLMANREPMKLKGITALHNLILCIGSAAMFMAGLIGSIQVYQVHTRSLAHLCRRIL